MVRDAGGGPGGGFGDAVTADYAALEQARVTFEEFAAAFTQGGVPLGHGYDTAVAGAGQFRADLQPGAVKFLLSWRAVFDVACTDCQLIAANIGRQSVDLQALDTQLAAGVQL